MRPHGILFSNLSDERNPSTDDDLPTKILVDTIERIGPKRILPARQWMQCALTATLRPSDVCLTFDGSHRWQYETALPVLQSFGLTAFWFVNTGVCEGQVEPAKENLRIAKPTIARASIKRSGPNRKLWMGNDDLKNLHSLGHVIGLHSHTRPARMDLLPIESQQAEYEKNFSYLTNLLGESPQTMSHPGNSYNRDTLSILRQMGIVLGFRANMMPGRSELEYPREDYAMLVKAMAA